MTQRVKYWLLGILLIPCWVIAIHYEIDLVNLYAVTKYLGTDITRVYAQNGSLGRWFYPPFSLVLFGPLGKFSWVTVKYFWIALQTVSYFFIWATLYKLYPYLNRRETWWSWVIVFILAINPIHNNFQSNNIQLMLAVLLFGAEWLSYQKSKKRDLAAGFLVAMAASIKVFPLFMCAYYWVAKNWRVRAGMILGFVVTSGLPFVVFGTQDGLGLYRDFFTNLTTYSQENSFAKVPDLLCWPAVVSRLMIFVENPTGILTAKVVKYSVLGISALFFGWTWLTSRTPSWHSSRVQLHYWALATALMAFLNPSTRPHYFIFYLPAFASVLEIIRSGIGAQNKAVLRWLVALSTLLIAFTAEGVTGKTLNDQLEFWSLPTYGALLLCIGTVLAIRMSRKNIRAAAI